MSENKYAKYITTNIKEDSTIPGVIEGPSFAFRGARIIPEAKANFGWNYITKPYFIDRFPHTHEADEYLFFLAPQFPDPFSAFNAEIDFSLGEEQEKHVISEPSLIYIPKGLVHAPLNFRKINKPLLFGVFLLTPNFTSKINGEVFSYEGPGVDGEPMTIDIDKI